MIEKISEFASEVVDSMSRRGFVQRMGAAAAGVLTVICGGKVAESQYKLAQCCYYNCRTGSRSIYLWVKRKEGCIGCPSTATVDNIPGCRLIDFRCVKASQGC